MRITKSFEVLGSCQLRIAVWIDLREIDHPLFMRCLGTFRLRDDTISICVHHLKKRSFHLFD